ncbi:TetR/AcrR family transcriptional regulator [Nocardia sp.]|uniref:TetR/AcrR family transcriptional regulator n=1 Tax=Nocardia sp. TaxID=1821 RepID=UPI002621349F|nr:TetR/AcrR family transcriptional regulator [Nocardia sp.]
MPKGVTKRRPITVAALLDAALALFAEQGFGATSIAEICARAGLTKGAYYSNFGDKDELFLALFDREWTVRLERLRLALPSGGDPVATLSDPALLPSVVDEAERRWLLVSAEFGLHAVRRPALARMLLEHEARGRAALAALLTEALAAAGRVPLLPVEDLTRLIVTVVEGENLHTLTENAAGYAESTTARWELVETLMNRLSAPGGDTDD